MANKKEMDAKKELARHLYMNSTDSQKTVAFKVGVSTVTMNRWVKVESWDSKRAAKKIGRSELIQNILVNANEKLEKGEMSADEMSKVAATIERLDKQTNVVTIIEVFSAYNNWLVSRMALDPELTPELVKVMNKYQDIFIGEQLGNTKIG